MLPQPRACFPRIHRLPAGSPEVEALVQALALALALVLALVRVRATCRCRRTTWVARHGSATRSRCLTTENTSSAAVTGTTRLRLVGWWFGNRAHSLARVDTHRSSCRNQITDVASGLVVKSVSMHQDVVTCVALNECVRPMLLLAGFILSLATRLVCDWAGTRW